MEKAKWVLVRGYFLVTGLIMDTIMLVCVIRRKMVPLRYWIYLNVVYVWILFIVLCILTGGKVDSNDPMLFYHMGFLVFFIINGLTVVAVKSFHEELNGLTKGEVIAQADHINLDYDA
jgi:hypothetical protein